jgi:LysR family transcriptional regulator, nitrogen assimilation regulatory protein
MKLHHLKYFLAIAEEGSFSAAARRVHVAQPALSQHMKILETELGVRLFERTAHGIKLTPFGDKLREHTIAIQRHIELALDDVRSTGQVLRGEVRMSLPVALSGLLIAPLITAVKDKYPGIDLKITDLMMIDASKLLQSGGVDIAILPNASRLENVEVESILVEQICLVGKAVSPLMRGDSVAFEKLSRIPLVLAGERHELRKQLDAEALKSGSRLNVRYEQDSVQAIKSIILSGLAHTVAPFSMFYDEIARGELCARRIIRPTIERTHFFAWPKTRAPTAAVRSVQKVVLDIIRTHHANAKIKGRMLA